VGIASDRLSAAGRAAHDVGLAAILGGNLFAGSGAPGDWTARY